MTSEERQALYEQVQNLSQRERDLILWHLFYRIERCIDIGRTDIGIDTVISILKWEVK
ncbi:hypothetical protein ACW2QC_09145 [Virgibacillus sp. FSP13]